MTEEGKEQQGEQSQIKVRQEDRGMAPAEQWGMGSPFSMLRRFHEEMDRMFERMFGGMPMSGSRRGLPSMMAEMGIQMPSVDVWETSEEVMVRVDLPGVPPENIEIYTTEDSVTIRAESQQEQEQKERGYYRTERRYGRFDRNVDLPANIKQDEAKATFKNGVLEIKLPKMSPAGEKMTKVPVESEERMAGTRGGERREEDQQQKNKQQ